MANVCHMPQWCTIFVYLWGYHHVTSLSLWNLFEDRIPVDSTYECPIFKWVAVACINARIWWHYLVPAMATRATIDGHQGCLVWTHCGLTHWGRVTHICVGKLTIIGSDNGLSPGRRQAIIWTNAEIMLIRPLENFSEIWIGIQTFSFKKCTWKCRLRNGVHFVSASMC